ncbi:MAG: hypothetical protein ACFE8G_12300 [Candidatus Hermodarchaeota archaeon]
MKRRYLILTKIAIFLTFSLIVFFSLKDYLLYKQLYEWYSYELTLMRAKLLIFLNIDFFLLVFVIKISLFKKLYLILIIFGITAWLISHFNSILNLNLLSNVLEDILELILFISTSIVPSGLLIIIVYYIKKYTTKFEGKVIGKYHVHEGLFGLLLIGLGIMFFTYRTYLIQFEIFLKEFKVYLAIIMILLYFFLFFGGFFILRDFNDLIRLRFIKKIPISQKKPKQNASIFNSINHENISFFRKSKLFIFPIGVLLTAISFSMVIYSTKFIHKDALTSKEAINLGYLLSIFAGAIIGYDWVRVFKQFYPIQYEEIEFKIINLLNSDS